jgi:hypothetical protein
MISLTLSRMKVVCYHVEELVFLTVHFIAVRIVRGNLGEFISKLQVANDPTFRPVAIRRLILICPSNE